MHITAAPTEAEFSQMLEREAAVHDEAMEVARLDFDARAARAAFQEQLSVLEANVSRQGKALDARQTACRRPRQSAPWRGHVWPWSDAVAAAAHAPSLRRDSPGARRGGVQLAKTQAQESAASERRERPRWLRP